MVFTTNLANKVLNENFGLPKEVFLGLHTTTGEVTGGSYTRQKVILGTAINKTITNTQAVAYPIATANWGLITKAVLYDESTAGNALDETTLAIDSEVNENEQFNVAIGDVKVSLS